MFGNPVGVVGGRAVLSAPGGTFTVSVEGDVDLVSTGSAVAAGGGRIFVSLCDDDLACSVEALTVEGEPVGTVAGTVAMWGPGVVSSQGRLAIPESDERGDVRILVDGEVIAEATRGYVGGLAWSPDGRWLFEMGDGEVRVHDLAGGAPRTVEVDAGMSMNWPFLIVVQPG